MLLITVPLIFGILFVLLVYSALSETERRFNHELHLKDAMIEVDCITRKIFSARICAASYFACQDKFYKDSFDKQVREAVLQYKHLQKMLKGMPKAERYLTDLKSQILMNNRMAHLLVRADAPGLDVSQLFHKEHVVAFMTNRPAFNLMKTLRSAANKEAAATLMSMNTLQGILLAGLVVSILTSIVFVVYFSLKFSTRVLRIVDNTNRLARGQVLAEPLSGRDEIAELDQFLYKSANQIRELEKFKQELIGVVSHELKSPLTSLSGFLSGLETGIFGEISQKTRDRVKRARKNVERLMVLVTELLDMDKIEAGKLELSLEEVEIADIVNASIDSVREFAEQSRITIKAETEAKEIVADKERLIQVIVNLLSNAIKFSPEQGLVTVKTLAKEDFLECRIIDQGRGIPDDFRKTIFEPFKQVDSSDGTTKKGTGIGLTISRSIVEQHGGEIGVDSVLGEGSTFWFKIPYNASKIEKSGGFSLSERSGSGSGTVAATKAQGSIGRFGVLQKGLVLISIPLIFQLGFVSTTGYLLYQIREQVNREERSKEMVDTLNLVAEQFGIAANMAMTYIATQDPDAKQSWLAEKKKALELLDKVKRLSAGDAKQLENLRKTESWIENGFKVVESLLKTEETNIADLLQHSGFIEQTRPLEESQEAQENLLKLEREQGKKLAKERDRMIANTESILLAGIFLNIAISLGLSIYLMQALTNRLKHVTDNTARLVKRETLLTPLPGSDEIAYLDRTFYEAAKHLVELEAFKREIISIVSHELRTPLMSVASVFELLSAGALGELSEKAQRRMCMAQSETNRLIRLINNLLDIEKMEAGKFVLDYRDTSVETLTDAAVSAVANIAESKGIAIEIESLDLSLKLDKDRIVQVIINLLSNALKFSEEGGQVKLEVRRDTNDLEISVSDNGRGIPDDMKSRIFHRFVQVEKNDASQRGGSGLGLALSKCIIEQHHGNIGVESELGKGSRFWFRIPLYRTGHEDKDPALTAAEASRS